jgi:hypothetical protein
VAAGSGIILFVLQFMVRLCTQQLAIPILTSAAGELLTLTVFSKHITKATYYAQSHLRISHGSAQFKHSSCCL